MGLCKNKKSTKAWVTKSEIRDIQYSWLKWGRRGWLVNIIIRKVHAARASIPECLLSEGTSLNVKQSKVLVTKIVTLTVNVNKA